MKRIFLLLGLILLFRLLNPNIASAALSCPSAETTCPSLDGQGSCPSPCIRVVTKQGTPGRPPVPAYCQCQEPENETESLGLGESCQRDSDCASGHCWGGYNESPVCQSTDATTARQNEQLDSPGEGLFSTQDGVLCTDNAGNTGIQTAVGCIPFTDETALTGFLLGWAIGIGGGIAFLLILYAGFIIMTSQGDPKRLQAGRELLTSAIGGLILIIFSVFILRFIGVDILKIQGLFAQ